jgi:membrane protease YdiL (CAAX protease family)
MEGIEGAGQHPPKRIQLAEVLVFLFLITPSVMLSSFTIQRASLTFPMVAVATILQDTALLLLIFFFVWRNGEPFSSLGWSLGRAWREVLLGVVLFVPMVLLIHLVESLLRSTGLSVPEAAPSYLIPSGVMELALAMVFLVVVAVSEEVIFRGYLVLRFSHLLQKPGAAVLLAAVVFSLGHGYQGTGGILGVWVLGVIFGAVYLWRGSLIAPMIMHFLQNFVGVVLIPLQKGSGTIF